MTQLPAARALAGLLMEVFACFLSLWEMSFNLWLHSEAEGLEGMEGLQCQIVGQDLLPASPAEGRKHVLADISKKDVSLKAYADTRMVRINAMRFMDTFPGVSITTGLPYRVM